MSDSQNDSKLVEALRAETTTSVGSTVDDTNLNTIAATPTPTSTSSTTPGPAESDPVGPSGDVDDGFEPVPEPEEEQHKRATTFDIKSLMPQPKGMPI
jgi:hypothetical protein